MSSCLDPQTSLIPQIIKGEDQTLTVQLNDEATKYPYDITGVTEIEALFLKTDGTALSKKYTLAQVVILNALAGKFQILLTTADTLLLKLSEPGTYSSFEVRLTIGGKVTYIQFVNSIQVVQSLFP